MFVKQEESTVEDPVQISGSQVYFEGHPVCMYCGTVLDADPEEPISTTVGYVCGGCQIDYFLTCEICGEIYPMPDYHWTDTLPADEEEESLRNLCPECRSVLNS